jgi:D-lactate dehydrogenase
MLEFMDDECVRLAREVGGADIPPAGALLMIEVDGDEAVLGAAVAAVATAAQGPGCLAVAAAASDAEREQLWVARKALSPALRTIAAGKINEDVVVPVSRIPELVRAVRAARAKHDLPIVVFGHAGNGNLHVNILFDPDDTAQATRADAALADVFDAVIALEGLVSGEHGIGLVKRDLLARSLDPGALALMRGMKALFDPDGILNPGKVLPP